MMSADLLRLAAHAADRDRWRDVSQHVQHASRELLPLAAAARELDDAIGSAETLARASLELTTAVDLVIFAMNIIAAIAAKQAESAPVPS